MKKTTLLALLVFCFTPFVMGQEIPGVGPSTTGVSKEPSPATAPLAQPAPSADTPIVISTAAEPAQAQTPVLPPAASTGTIPNPPVPPTGGGIAVSTGISRLPETKPPRARVHGNRPR